MIMDGKLTRCFFTLVLALGAAQAHAIPQLRLTTNTGATVTVTDGGAGDSSATDGLVVFMGALGDWNVNVTTGISRPIIGSELVPMLDLNSLNVTSNSGPAGSIKLELTD